MENVNQTQTVTEKRRGRKPGTPNKTESKATLRLQIKALEVKNAQLESLLTQAMEEMAKIRDEVQVGIGPNDLTVLGARTGGNQVGNYAVK